MKIVPRSHFHCTTDNTNSPSPPLLRSNFLSFILLFFRDGRLRVGDEIINVNSQRLRGLEIDEAIATLKHAERDLDIVISRDSNTAADGDDTALRESGSRRSNGRPRPAKSEASLPTTSSSRIEERHHEYANLRSHFEAVSSGAASDVGATRTTSNNNFVTRTYIGGNPSSSLAIKIHKRSLSRLASNPGSLTSLHETSLNSDVEDVRSSCSAYRPVHPRSFGETRSCVGGIRDASGAKLFRVFSVSNAPKPPHFQSKIFPLLLKSHVRDLCSCQWKFLRKLILAEIRLTLIGEHSKKILIFQDSPRRRAQSRTDTTTRCSRPSRAPPASRRAAAQNRRRRRDAVVSGAVKYPA